MRAIDYNELFVFARVARSGSFSTAARELGVPSSTVSRKIASLERRLGVQLLERSTRHVRVTPLGAVYQSHCERALAAAEEGERTLRHLEESPRGALRITAPHAFGESALPPIVERYVAMFPEVRLDLWLTDDVVDLAAREIDIAFRFGGAAGRALVARVVGTATSVLCAAPGYLEAHPPPRSIPEVATHPLLLFGGMRDEHTLRFVRDGASVELRVSPRAAINSYSLLRTLCIQGHGIALLPTFFAEESLLRGRLVQVLPEVEMATAKISMVRPEGVRPSKIVRAFVELTREHVEQHGWAPQRR